MDELLSIGEFAGRTGLSRSALRFYDENALLAPRRVDEDTGYRSYGVDQLADAELIRSLRDADLPIAAVREYLTAGTDARREILDAHVRSFRQRAHRVERAVDGLRGELDHREAGDVGWCAVAPAAFATALRQVRFAIADPAVRAELGAVRVQSRENALRLVATDSYRLAVRDLVSERTSSVGVRGVIDADRVPVLLAGLDGAGELHVAQDGAGTLHAVVDGRRIALGGIGADFPDYARILAELPTGRRVALPRRALGQAVSQAAVPSGQVALAFGPEGLEVTGGGALVRLPAAWPGDRLTVLMDQGYLTEAIDAMVGPDVVLEVIGAAEPLVLSSADTGTFTVLTMPVRPPGRA